MNARFRPFRAALVLVAVVECWALPAVAQPAANYDESKVGQFAPIDPLTTADGKKVTTPDLWVKVRRPELLRLFETEMYGRVPDRPASVRPMVRLRSEDRNALGGKAIRREVTIAFTEKLDGPRMDLLIYLPKDASASRQVPAFLALNFQGNHTVNSDPGIPLSRRWTRRERGGKAVHEEHVAPESSRGAASSRWPVERIIERGYALATACYEDIDPDYDDGFRNGVHPLFYREGQTRPGPDEWGSIAAWAWGLSRSLDYLETMPEIDGKKVIVMGHSRLGKTALWAGATDPRFAIVISNNSGCGGAALSRRIYGETVGIMNRAFPHWLCANHQKYTDHEELLPFDQHELIALIAPRPVLVCSAEGDRWADPKGEFLGALGADPVYRLLGTDGLAITEMPRPAKNSLINSTIGYRIRPGGHDVTADDWEAYMDFADHHLGRKSAGK